MAPSRGRNRAACTAARSCKRMHKCYVRTLELSTKNVDCQVFFRGAKGLRSAWTVTPGYAHLLILWRALKRHSKRFLLTINVMGPTISCMRLHAAVTNARRVSAFRYLLQETSR